MLDLAFWLVVSGLVGSRLTYGLVNARSFFHACVDGDGPWWRDCTSLLAVWEGGLVFYGGVAAAALVALVFARREGWSFGAVGDLFAPALAHRTRLRPPRLLRRRLLLRQGDRARGSASPSRAAASPSTSCSARARSRSAPARRRPLHPAQLYEAAGELALFGLLCLLRPRLRRRPGALLLCYLGLYALLRFVVEIFRGDILRGFPVEMATPRLAGWLGLPPAEPIFFSAGQLGSLLTAAAVAAALVWRHRAPRTPAP